ncbi:hypothetical protein LARV_00802 [Longilinea arvoryzae]|uniref:Uncharacterized protein n=1 Tax=Longilinea arvoryzae TaxID=360412 RepID=A0A0S7BE09_9CHLR|nr:hypothetical protein LARV_00802 [Longilinea arvoryzae]
MPFLIQMPLFSEAAELHALLPRREKGWDEGLKMIVSVDHG